MNILKKYIKSSLYLEALVILAFLVLSPMNIHAEDGWIININGATGADTDRVMVGIIAGTTDGFDISYDATSMFKTSAAFALYMDRADWGKSSPYAWIDVTGSGLPYEWTFYSYTSEIGRGVDLGWDASKVPSNVNIELVDNYTGVVLNMRDVNGYSFTSVSASRGFTVRALSAVK